MLPRCGCTGGGRGQGEYVAETTYRYVGKGKGTCTPLDYRPPPPVKPQYCRQFAGFASMAALLTLAGWVVYGMIIGDTRAVRPEAPAELATPTAGEAVAAPAPSPVGTKVGKGSACI